MATRRRRPERVDIAADDADDADDTDKKERESMAAGMALSRTSDFARHRQSCAASPLSAKSAKSAVLSLLVTPIASSSALRASAVLSKLGTGPHLRKTAKTQKPQSPGIPPTAEPRLDPLFPGAMTGGSYQSAGCHSLDPQSFAQAKIG